MGWMLAPQWQQLGNNGNYAAAASMRGHSYHVSLRVTVRHM